MVSKSSAARKEKAGKAGKAEPRPEAVEPRGQSASSGCVLCGGEQLAPAFEIADKSALGSVAIHQCLQCSVLVPAYARPESSEDATATQVVLHEHDWEATTRQELEALAKDCDGIVASFAELLGPPDEGRMVCEIGAGRGGLLTALKARGYRVIGCEPSPVLSGIGRRFGGLSEQELRNEGVEELLGHIQAKQLPVRTYFLWHVLEHLRQPWDTLRRIAELCEPGDHVALQCPLVRQDYVYPEHYFFLTETAIIGLAESSGFELAKLDYDHERAFVGFVLRRSTGSIPERKWAGAASDGAASGEASSGHLLRLKIEEERRLRSQLEAQARLLGQHTAAIAAMEPLLEERMRAIDGQSQMIRERDRTIEEHRALLAELEGRLQAQAEQLAALRRDEGAVQSELRRLHEALAGVAPAAGQAARPAASLVSLLSLHTTQRLYQRWQGVRGLRVSPHAPSIEERLLRFAGEHLPVQVALRLDAARLEVQVARVSGKLKGMALRGARVAKRVVRRGR